MLCVCASVFASFSLNFKVPLEWGSSSKKKTNGNSLQSTSKWVREREREKTGEWIPTYDLRLNTHIVRSLYKRWQPNTTQIVPFETNNHHLVFFLHSHFSHSVMACKSFKSHCSFAFIGCIKDNSISLFSNETEWCMCVCVWLHFESLSNIIIIVDLSIALKSGFCARLIVRTNE